MRLLILGATGGTGRALLDQASRRGHEVTALVRSPQKLAMAPKSVTVLRGDPLSVAELRAALPGHDAVLTALGPPGFGRTTIFLDWTIARPPRLTNGPLTRRYRVADGHQPGGMPFVSRADVADFLLNELEQKRHVHQIVGMAAGNGRGRQ